MLLQTLLLITWIRIFHPFHVSVCDVEYKPGRQALQVSQRVFADDLENALNKYFRTRVMLDDTTRAAEADSLIGVYVIRHLTFRADGRQLTGRYLGHEVEADAIWCYIEYQPVPPFSELEVKSTIFLELFDDQENIIHFKKDEFEKSIRLNADRKAGVLRPA